MRIILLLLPLLLSTIAYGQEESEIECAPLSAPCKSSGVYFDTQFLFFDSPIREIYYHTPDIGHVQEFAPRFILGYDDNVGARVRWWTYDRETEIQPVPDDLYVTDMRLKFNVLDLEATTHVRTDRSDFVFSGGARIAAVRFDEYVAVGVADFQKTTMLGLTAAAEGRTCLYSNDAWGTGLVYGGRLSLLQENWHGHSDDNALNVKLNAYGEHSVVPELFVGFEAHYGHAFTRFTVEMQDWEGRAQGVDTHSFDFTGVGFDLGYLF